MTTLTQSPTTAGPDAAPVSPAETASATLAHIVAQRPHGEVRPQQDHMVRLVADAIDHNHHLLVQAGTGTGKSLGYLIPAITSGKRVIVTTATKQLGEQIINDDMPILADLIPKAGGPAVSYAFLMGRSNYLCQRAVDTLNRLDEAAPDDLQDALIEAPARPETRRPSTEDLRQLNSLITWADTTSTGERSHAPACTDKVWNQVSTDAASCVGRNCAFYDTCFAEAARNKARESTIVVTNHAQVAQDLISEQPFLGEWDTLIVDEVHELESYLSSAWGIDMTPSAMRRDVTQCAKRLPRSETYDTAREQAVKAVEDLDAFAELIDPLKGPADDLPEAIHTLTSSLSVKLMGLRDALDVAADATGGNRSTQADIRAAAMKAKHLFDTLIAATRTFHNGDEVRWIEPGFNNRSASIKTAPLWIGPELIERLGDRNIIATSATMTVGGSFDSFVRTLALTQPAPGHTTPRPYKAVDVGSPFNYQTQACLYIPANSFPSPLWQTRDAHTAAVQDDLVALVKAAGGRTLALFTTRRGAEAAAARLRTALKTPVLCQGEAPNSQLIETFRADESATLCATMGLWHGLNAPGPTCSLVVLDKLPFAPMDDPLMDARKKAVEKERKGRGFNEVYVAAASVMLSQGVGRLIRTATDKGVVAIMDTRLVTKGYGRTMIDSMPTMNVVRNRAAIEAGLARLAAAADEAARESKK